MKSKLLWTLVVLAMICAVPAWAESFTFNVDYCSNPCLGGVAASNDGGTVTLTQSATNVVDVLVQLDGLVFHNNGLEGFAFNIYDATNTALQNPTLTQITSGTLANGDLEVNTTTSGGTWSGTGAGLDIPAGNTDGAGNPNHFGYALNCVAGSGECAGGPSTLEFQVDLTGLTVADFETLTGSGGKTVHVDFAANVADGTCTGPIGAGNGINPSVAATVNGGGTACTPGTPPTVPEPTSILLLGTVLAFVGNFTRKRLAA